MDSAGYIIDDTSTIHTKGLQMPRIDLRNLAIILSMAVVGFFVTTYLVRKFGD